VENPLQEIAGGFTFAGMKRLIAFLIALLPVTMLAPLASQASAACSNGFCTQTFFFTGSTQEFLVPEGVNTIRFEVTGGSGSRGGAGGLVTGSLSNLPERLIIEVGQAGTFGSNRAGGYNGGGASGGSRGNEGSGGGASDIRLSDNLQSRIVVAGGGGGGGGGVITAAGAAGGGLIAERGLSGQAAAGSGGTQTQGGAGGTSNGNGQQPSEGSFGLGGDGGSGNIAGGGGGGGGWYGGGGGGGDDVSGGGDAAGAGGGSSYTSDTYASNVVHQAGVQWGHGRIYIHYQLPTEVLSFTGEQMAFGQIKYQIQFDQSAQDLNPDDFSYSRADCSIWRISLNDNLAEVTLSGCGGDEVTLTLKPKAVGLENFGPMNSVSATVLIDRTGPYFSWASASETISSSDLAVDFTLSDGIVPEPSNFEVSGCELAVEPSRALLSSCSEGVHTLKFKALSLSDTWGNPGPVSDSIFTLTVDRTPPTAHWSEIVVSGDGPFTFSTELSISEVVSWSSSAVTFNSDTPCESGNDGNQFWAVCDYGMVSWMIDSSVLSDVANNQGSGSSMVSRSLVRPVIPEPAPKEPEIAQPIEAPAPAAVEPTPTTAAPSEPAPTGPVIVIPPAEVAEPTPTPEPTSSEPETSSPEPEVVAAPELEFLDPLTEVVGGVVSTTLVKPSRILRPVSVASSSEVSSSNEVVSERLQQPAAEVTPAPVPEIDLVAGPELDFESREEFPWLLVVSAALVAMLGIGIWRFSGR
jgi:hypothetical protein